MPVGAGNRRVIPVFLCTMQRRKPANVF